MPPSIGKHYIIPAHFHDSYKAKARTTPPTIAIPPVAIFDIAAFELAAGEADDVELLPDDVVVEEVWRVVDPELEPELLETGARVAEPELLELEVVTTLVDATLDEVETKVLVDIVELVKLGPWESWTVVVEPRLLDPEPVAEAEPEELPLPLAEPPTMWNGLEYWNSGFGSLAVESRVIWNP